MFLLLGGVLASAGPTPASAALFSSRPDRRPIMVVARDAIGHVLAGVDVRVLDQGAGGTTLARGTTDRHGQLRLAGLVPGVYRVAAVKDGYREFRGELDTWLGSTLELLLQPAAVHEDDRPTDASWVLRLPRRSVLRETESVEYVRRSPPAPSHATRALYELLSVRVDQTFSRAESRSAGAVLDEPREGTETRMQLAGTFGERGRLRFQGARRRVDRPGGDSSDRGDQRGRDARVLLGLSYDTGRQGSLDVQAFLDRRDLAPGPVATAGLPLQAQQSWGYDASWSTQLDPASRLSLAMDFRDAKLHAAEFARPDGDPAGPRIERRTVGAGGTYERAPGPGHRVKVAFRAQFAELPWLPVGALEAAAPDVAGWTVRVNAEDSWAASAPLTVVYGLGYRHAVERSEASLLVPRFGAVWSHRGIAVRGVVSYHALAERIASEVRPPIGYRTEIELPLPSSTSVRCAAVYEPIQFEPVSGFAPRRERAGIAPPFQSDGNAAARESSVLLSHASPRVTTTLRFARGDAVGMLTTPRAYDEAVVLLTDGRLRYSDGSVGVRIPPAGTDLVLAYRRVDERPANPQTLAVIEESLELRFQQDVLRGASAAWRLLLALGYAELEHGRQDPSSGHRLSAGVSVSF